MPQTFKAGGNIPPCRFVKYSADGTVVVSGAGERSIGISAPWTRRLPGETSSPFSGLDDGYVAISGENVTVYTDGDKEVMIELGGTVTAGQRLMASTLGVGVASTTNLDQYGAAVRTGGVSGELVACDVMIGEVSV